MRKQTLDILFRHEKTDDIKKVTLLLFTVFVLQCNRSILQSWGFSRRWIWQDAFITRARNIREIILDQAWEEEEERERELRELRTHVVNLGITPCGLETSLEEMEKGSRSVAIRSHDICE